MKRIRQPFDVENLVRRSTSGPCFICEFISGNPDYAHVSVAETESAVAFLNKYPTLFGSILVAPKRHAEDVTGSFSLEDYLELQQFVYCVAEAIRHVLRPERIYILSLGSLAANSHVHWHLAPLPAGVPIEQQQYYALMHENGVIDASDDELSRYAADVQQAIQAQARDGA